MPSISMYIVCPHAFLCDLLQHRLATTESDVSCAGTWNALDGLVDAIDRARPDVVVFDAALCDSEAPDIIAACLNRHPELKIVLLYDSETVHTALECFAAGAKASISKECGFDEFLATVRAAASGEVIIPSKLLTLLVDRFRVLRHSVKDTGTEPLSARDSTILKMIAGGATNNEIAHCLGLSPQTVKNHLTKVFCQLGVANRNQAAAWWRDHLMNA